MVEFGHVLPRPGKEQHWFADLPSELESYLCALGTKQNMFRL